MVPKNSHVPLQNLEDLEPLNNQVQVGHVEPYVLPEVVHVQGTFSFWLQLFSWVSALSRFGSFSKIKHPNMDPK